MEKYGKIFSYRNSDEAVVGRRYLFTDYLKKVNNPVDGWKMIIRELESVDDGQCPFKSKGGASYQFIREVIEEEPAIMSHRQLSEWLAKGNGQMRSAGALLYPLLVYEPKNEHDAVPKNIRIRRWGSDEWVVPTVDIYERDCRKAD